MILEDFALLASDTARTKAYLSAMLQEHKLPGMCIVYSDDIAGMQEKAGRYKMTHKSRRYFDVEIPLLSLVQEADIPCIFVQNKDINSEQMRVSIQNLRQKYIIYSGYGGSILRPNLFQMDKKYIHVHAGLLPQYRGSTTAYYSYLQEGKLGATAIFLSEGIDEGEIIVSDTFEIPEEPIDMDYIYEPYMRSRVLMKAIDRYLSDGVLTACEQSAQGAETYFIIHPVLKHIAILGIQNQQER